MLFLSQKIRSVFNRILSPNFILKLSSKTRPYLLILLPFAYIVGIYFSFFFSEEDYQQGEYVRIMYIHVPSAWLSLMIFSIIGFCSISSLIWKNIFAFIIAKAAAPIGASFALITLITGSLWGKPIWGDWWVWDARLTSMLILFIFYLVYMVISNASENIYRVEKPAAAIGILGFINVPIVKFSVNLWFSLHQPASIIRSGGPSIDSSMLITLIIMFLANLLLFLLLLSFRIEYIYKKYKIRNI